MDNNELDNIEVSKIINVQAYKYDGTLYRQWNGAKVIEVSPTSITLFMYKTKVLELNSQKWVVREPMIWEFRKDAFYNTTGMLRKRGVHYYTNLASVPVFEENTLKFIDFDIDIKAYPGEKIKVVDKQEFKKHSIEYNYSPELIEKINKTTKKIIEKIKFQEDFFDKDVVDTFVGALVKEKELAKKFLKFNFD